MALYVCVIYVELHYVYCFVTLLIAYYKYLQVVAIV